MLLRRIIEHVKAQNWFAVGLGFVIGVFAAAPAAKLIQSIKLPVRRIAAIDPRPIAEARN